MVYLKRVKWLLSWIILWYPPVFLVGTVPTQILALYFYCFNPDYLFKLSSKPISLKKEKRKKKSKPIIGRMGSVEHSHQ